MKSKPTQDLRTRAIPALPDIIGENMAVHIREIDTESYILQEIKTKKNIVSEGILFKKKRILPSCY